MDKTFRQKIDKKTWGREQHYRQNEPNRYRTFCPTAAEHTFFSSTHGTFSRVDHLLAHKTSLNKFQIEIIPVIFSDHNGMKLQFSTRRKTGKFTNVCRLNNTLLNNN